MLFLLIVLLNLAPGLKQYLIYRLLELINSTSWRLVSLSNIGLIPLGFAFESRKGVIPSTSMIYLVFVNTPCFFIDIHVIWPTFYIIAIFFLFMYFKVWNACTVVDYNSFFTMLFPCVYGMNLQGHSEQLLSGIVRSQGFISDA